MAGEPSQALGVKRRSRNMKEKFQNIKATLAIILFPGFTFCIFAPFEMYALNSEEVWFMLQDFWFIPLICGTVFMAATVALALFLKEKLLRVYQGVLFGLGFSIYIQGNFLNIKLGAMNGEIIEWGDYTVRMIVNLVLWVLLTVGFAVLRYRDIKYSEMIMSGLSLFMTTVQLLTLIVLLLPLHYQSEIFRYSNSVSYPTDKDVMSLSSENNVLVFVLDRYDEDFFTDLIAEKPEFKERLDGFTYYSNMVGEYSATNWAIPFMLSGQYCLQGSFATWRDSSCEGDVYWEELIAHGYEMGIYSNMECIPSKAALNSINSVKAFHSVSDYNEFTVLLYRFVMCKYFPDIVKPAIWLIGSEFNDYRWMDGEFRDWESTNLIMVDQLDEKAVTADKDIPQFKFIHIGGTHSPWDIDEEGNRIEGYSDEKVCAEGSLNIVLKYMDEMKELGIYDCSAIIITADHGLTGPEPSSPVFLVKPAGIRGDMTESKAPVSHKDLGATVLDLTNMELDVGKYGTSVLDVKEGDERERVCYRHVFDDIGAMGEPLYKLVEYNVDSEDNALENFHQTGVVYDMWGDIDIDT